MSPNDIVANPLDNEESVSLQFLLLRAMKHGQLYVTTTEHDPAVFVNIYVTPLQVSIFWPRARKPADTDIDPSRIGRLTC